MAAIWSQATSAYADAFRYDPWGETIAHSPTSSARSPWRYQGRLVEGEASDAELYDFGFRSYAADTGAFASLDDVAGSAQDVRSLNRFLYANADPATLIDPDGHYAGADEDYSDGPTGTELQHIRDVAAQTGTATGSTGGTNRTDSADAGSSSTPTRSVKADDWSSDATSRVSPLWLQRELAGYPDSNLDGAPMGINSTMVCGTLTFSYGVSFGGTACLAATRDGSQSGILLTPAAVGGVANTGATASVGGGWSNTSDLHKLEGLGGAVTLGLAPAGIGLEGTESFTRYAGELITMTQVSAVSTVKKGVLPGGIAAYGTHTTFFENDWARHLAQLLLSTGWFTDEHGVPIH